MKILALTMHQPEAFAVLAGWADCVNEEFEFPPDVSWLAVHVGREPTRKTTRTGAYCREGVRMALVRMQEQTGYIVPTYDQLAWGGFVGVVRIHGCSIEHDSPWRTKEQYAWMCGEAARVDRPIQCKGHPGLWSVPSSCLAQLAMAVRNTRRRSE